MQGELDRISGTLWEFRYRCNITYGRSFQACARTFPMSDQNCLYKEIKAGL